MQTESVQKNFGILLDTCVSSDAKIGMVVGVPIEGMVNRLAVIKTRKKYKSDWHNQQVACLPTIAKLVRNNSVKLHKHMALREESMRSSGSYGALRLGDLFDGLEIHHVHSAVNYHLFFDNEHALKNKYTLLEFCKWLIDGFTSKVIENLLAEEYLKPFELKNLKNIERFREICHGLSEKHFDDAFHLWTGETNNLSHFLTTNRNFVQALKQNKSLVPTCKPVSPSELLIEFGIQPTEPLPFGYDKQYLLNGMEY